MAMRPKDPIELAIFCNLAAAITEEACGVLVRTAYTTFIKEVQDFSVALARPDGTFFAYPGRSGVPTAVGLPMEDAIAAVSEWQPGDVLLSNDPYTTGGMVTHSPDVTMIAPIFYQGELIAFCWSFLHSSDVGGAVPGSLAASHDEIYQEGLRIPPAKLYRAGTLNKELYDILMANVRIPYQLWGDLQAMISAFRVATTRLVELFEKFGRDRAKELIDECLAYGEAKARAVIAEIPDGTYRFVDYLDDDIASPHPVRICLSLKKSGSEIHVDFTGTDPQVMAALNLATAGKRSHTWLTVGLMQFLLTADREMPVNGGILRPLSVTAPAGTIVHAVPPAALGGRVVAGIRVMDATFGALVQAIPGRVPAAGSGQGMLPVLSMPAMADGTRKVNLLQPLIGGTGGRPESDGFDGTTYSLGFLRNTPIEIIESEMDVLVHRYHYVVDSGGPGEFRGGLGVGLRAEALIPDTTIAIRGIERTRFAPWGVKGGECGSLTQPVATNPGRPDEKRHPKKVDVLRLQPGDVVEFATSGGGGYGDPLRRDPAQVARDVAYGYVSRAAAETAYGLVFKPDSPDADLAATRARRARRERGRMPLSTFNFCPARLEYDRVWNELAYAELHAILATLTIHARVYAKGAIMAATIAAQATPGAALTGADVRRGWQAAKRRLGIADAPAHA
jgi:N-methylhydantoinase B